MISKANNINSETWINQQPTYTWLNINDIPSSIFNSVWSFIESNNCDIHPTKAKYLIKK